jgi:hypothetical protein
MTYKNFRNILLGTKYQEQPQIGLSWTLTKTFGKNLDLEKKLLVNSFLETTCYQRL